MFSRDQLAAILAMVPERYRLLFEVLVTTGLRSARPSPSSASTSSSTDRPPRSMSVEHCPRAD